MKRKIAAIFVSAVTTVSSAALFAMNAFAEDAASGSANGDAQQAAGGGLLTFVLPLVLMFVLLYFMAIRPQKKREQEAKDMQNSLEVGDEVITSGGIVGMIFRISDDTVVIETGGERHKLRIKKWAIAENVSAAERAKAAQAKTKSPLAAAGVTDTDSSDKKKSKKSKKNEDSENE